MGFDRISSSVPPIPFAITRTDSRFFACLYSDDVDYQTSLGIAWSCSSLPPAGLTRFLSPTSLSLPPLSLWFDFCLVFSATRNPGGRWCLRFVPALARLSVPWLNRKKVLPFIDYSIAEIPFSLFLGQRIGTRIFFSSSLLGGRLEESPEIASPDFD